MSAGGRTGLAILYASGIVFLALELLSLLGIGWSRVAVVLAIALLAAGATRLPRASSMPLQRSPVDLLTILYGAAYTSFATAGAPWSGDFAAIWGLKARTFFEHGGIDFRFLAEPANAFAHPGDSQLVPLNLALPAILTGTWNDRWLGLFSAALAIAAALVVRDLAARDMPRHAAAAMALATMALASSRHIGLAETPLIAFMAAGLVFARRAVLGEVWCRVPAGILLGLAASTKNEGLTLVIAVLLAALLLRRAFVALAAVPALIAAPWLVARAIYGLDADIIAPGFLARAPSRLGELGSLAATLLERLDKPWLWVALLLASVAVVRRERFLLFVLLLQAAFVLGAYLVTPHDPLWQIATSWNRVSRQLLVPATLAALAALAARGGTVRT